MTTISKQPRGTSGTAAQIEKCREKMAETTERLRSEIEGPASATVERLRDAVETSKRPLLNLWADKSSSASEFVLLGSAGAPGIDSTDEAQNKPALEPGGKKRKAPSTPSQRAEAREKALRKREQREALVAQNDRPGRIRKGVLIAGGAAAAVASIGGAVAAIANNGPSQPTDPSITQNTNQTSNDDVKNAVDDYANTGTANVDSSQVGIRLDTFKKLVDEADSLSGDEARAISGAFSRLSPTDQSLGLEYLAQTGNEDAYNVCRVLSEATIGLDAFIAGVDAYDRDGGLDSDEKAALGDAFSRLDAAGQSSALDYLLETGDEDLYLLCRARASVADVSLDAFTKAVDAFDRDGGFDSEEMASLRDAFSRLDSASQAQALDHLLQIGNEDLYNACRSGSSAPVRLDGFTKAVSGFERDGGLDSDEVAALRDAFQRLDEGGQSEALEYLLEVGNEDLYNACKSFSSVDVGLDAFTAAVHGFDRDGGFDSDEVAALRDAISRLSPGEQSSALEHLLEFGNEDLYNACRTYVDSVEIGTSAFTEGVEKFDRDGGLDSDETAAIRDAFSRLGETGQEEALNFLLEAGHEDLFNACLQLAS